MTIPFLAKNEVVSCDIHPSTLDDSGESGGTRTRTCQVCHVHQHRYCCPNCRILYCSVGCYEGHELSCTEEFHQRNVSRVLNVEAKEISSGRGQGDARSNMQSILKRVHESTSSEDIILSSLPGTGRLSRAELVSLLEQLESLEDRSQSFEELMEKQPTRIQSILRGALASEAATSQNADFLQEWLIKPWNPWWLPQYSSLIEEDEDTDTSCNSTLLDDRLLAVPPFRSLSKKGNVFPLQYNLIDILYASVWAIRLYHGVENAVVAGSPRDVHQTLLQASSVLASTTDKPLLYSDLSEVLIECTRRSTASSSCRVPWKVLVQDVGSICSNYRFVARCLFDAEQLLRKERPKRKLQYYVSWALENKDIVSDLAPKIEEWADDWSLVQDGAKLAVKSASTGSEILPRRKQIESPLLVETATRSKHSAA